MITVVMDRMHRKCIAKQGSRYGGSGDIVVVICAFTVDSSFY